MICVGDLTASGVGNHGVVKVEWQSMFWSRYDNDRGRKQAKQAMYAQRWVQFWSKIGSIVGRDLMRGLKHGPEASTISSFYETGSVRNC